MNFNNQFQVNSNTPNMNFNSAFNNNINNSMQTWNNMNNNNSLNNSNMLNMMSMNNQNNNNMNSNMMMNMNMNNMSFNNNMNQMMMMKFMMNQMMMNNNSNMMMNNNTNNNNNLAMLNSKTDINITKFSKNEDINMNNFNKNQNNINQVQNSNQINPKCSLCLNDKNKLKKCKFCNTVYCENCLKNWLQKHNTCTNCKTNIKMQDMISLNLMKNNSNKKINNSNPQQNNFNNKSNSINPLNQVTYNPKSNNFINNIQNNPNNIINNNMNNNMNNNNIIMNNNMNNNNIIMNNNMNNNNINMNNNMNNNINENIIMCQDHNSRIEYYCVQCNKNYCSNCLVFFGQEVKKHQGHLILQISQMNNQNTKQLLDEYKKLPVTKNVLDNLIGLSNLKIRENEIKKCEAENFLNLIKDEYLKKIDEDSVELKSILEKLKIQKNTIENSISSIPNGFNNIINSNDYVQGGVLSQELKKINQVDRGLKNKIQEKTKKTPMLYIENYESDYLEFQLPFGGKYQEEAEVINKKLNFIPEFPCRLLMKFLQKKIYISLCIDINIPLNSFEVPKFFTYITLKNKKYGLEFSNLSDQTFLQNNANRGIRQQINAIDMEAEQFLYLVEENNKIRLKIFVIKIYYKYFE